MARAKESRESATSAEKLDTLPATAPASLLHTVQPVPYPCFPEERAKASRIRMSVTGIIVTAGDKGRHKHSNHQN